MPRNSGRSGLTTVWPIRRRPSERSESRCTLVPPIFDLIWVTLSWAISRPCRSRRGPRLQHRLRRHVLDRQAALGRDLLGTVQRLERGHGGVHHVDRVGRAERPGQHVADPRALEHGAHRAAGDDAGTGAGRLEQHYAGRRLTLHGVRDGGGDPGHPEEVLLGLFDALGDRRGHFLGLAVADTDHAVAVAHHDKRGEAEPTATLDHLGHPVDGDHALQVYRLLLGRAATAVLTALAPLAAATAAPRSSWH